MTQLSVRLGGFLLRKKTRKNNKQKNLNHLF